MTMKIPIIVKNIALYTGGNLPTGLWLSEVTHMYHKAKEKSYEITISPKGGKVPIDPESLKYMVLDKASKVYYQDLLLWKN